MTLPVKNSHLQQAFMSNHKPTLFHRLLTDGWWTWTGDALLLLHAASQKLQTPILLTFLLRRQKLQLRPGDSVSGAVSTVQATDRLTDWPLLLLLWSADDWHPERRTRASTRVCAPHSTKTPALSAPLGCQTTGTTSNASRSTLKMNPCTTLGKNEITSIQLVPDFSAGDFLLER